MASPTAVLPTWYRALAIVVGVISIALALVVLVEPVLALWILIYLLALALLVIGMDRLIAGISGHPLGRLTSIGLAATSGSGSAGPSDRSSGPMPPSPP